MPLLRRIGVVLFSIYAWTAGFAIMTLIVIVAVITMPFIKFKDSHKWLGGFGMGMVLRATFSRITITYDDRFDPDRRSMFCQNHVNLMDAHAACASIPHGFGGMMHAWQLNIPVYGWIMRFASGIPVRQGRLSVYREIAAMVKDRAERGISVLVFPEGSRTRDGKVHEFQRGVFMAARTAGIPVVPLAVRGMFGLNQAKSLRIKPSRISIHVGPQIETANMTNQQLRELPERMRAFIAQFVEEGTIPDASPLFALVTDPAKDERPADAAPS
jgi:1-acyl-sn-glycerol-3-phosphate acyltransferase